MQSDTRTTSKTQGCEHIVKLKVEGKLIEKSNGGRMEDFFHLWSTVYKAS